MKQLKVKDVLNAIFAAKIKGDISLDELYELPVYIGNDAELNGVHTAWCINIVKENDVEDSFIIDMINEDYANVEFENMAVLIS